MADYRRGLTISMGGVAQTAAALKKKEAWKSAVKQINSPEVKPGVDSIRENAGVHERTFLQETPKGDFVILTYEGENPIESYGKIMKNLPDDFADFVMDIHGVDVNAPPPPLPTLVYDSRN